MTSNKEIIIESTEDKIGYIVEEMKNVYLNDNRPWIIGYSGGKDSTTVVQLVFKMLMNLPEEKRTKKVYIVSSNTLIENPIILDYLKYNSQLIDNCSEKLNLPVEFKLVHPEYSNSYWANIIGKGLPTPTSIRFRWCTEKLKIQPSNKFIEDTVADNGEVIVLLGVRKSESIARKIRIQNREIEGYLLTPHETLTNTYVYNPIVELSTDDVWSVLLSNNGITPWNSDNKELFQLYRDSEGECPFTNSSKNGEVDTPSCGNSRFGCWLCTVVNKDKSLTGFIENGEDWLIPLLEFREWILSIRDKHEYRKQYRRDGNHYYRKVYLKNLPIDDKGNIDEAKIHKNSDGNPYIDLSDTSKNANKNKLYLELLPMANSSTIDMSKIMEDEKGFYIKVLGYGPFNFEGKQLILKKLLQLQKQMDYELITIEELKEIDQFWDNEEDLTKRKLVDIYYDNMGKKLPWHDYKKPMFTDSTLDKIGELCESKNVPRGIFDRLLIETNKNKYYSNKADLRKSVDKIINQKYLHKELFEGIENDN